MNIYDNLTFLNENSKYVFINKDKIYSFIDKFDGKINYNYWLNDLLTNYTEKEKIIFAFICEAMNFCFWGNKEWLVEYNNKVYHGSEALFFSIIKAVNYNKLKLDVADLALYKEKDLKNIMISNNELPSLFHERYILFRKTILILKKKGDNFFKQLFSLKSDIEILEYIINSFHFFRDQSNFNGRIISFNKKATLLVNDLFNLSPTIRKNIHNVNNLTGCADYSVPNLLFCFGILEYSDILRQHIDNEKKIKHNSKMEVEIRGNTLYVIELMKHIINKKQKKVNSVELDSFLWNMRNIYCSSSKPHHTECIYY